MTQISRVLVALVALFNIVLGLGFLLDPAGSAQRFLLEPLGTQGMATLRADFTAFFVVGGVAALTGAWRRDGAPLLVPLALLSVAITGRVVSLIADGAPGSAFPPMAVEAVMIAILLLGRRAFAEARP
ncbi:MULTISPECIES: hypothetical protein [unclassified Sphingomonas]|uniref:hypothetical protein n=1 Tax=unclassified Sphingomonas TaxID=196159 RepID=UPI0009294339|nr:MULTISPECIES: hypothetical protein [unclassified Sphingomonas]MBN8847427.1 hypothetical protein [Sphingomonas sp.]OJV32343.1 MAG: hypothetical protein BGO24_16375 [Sphingomonas sp. 67-36]